MALRPYNDPEYRRYRAWLTLNPQPCYVPGCDAVGDTVDHHPAIHAHRHIRGSGCCALRPACRHHNCSSGASAGNRKRMPSSGWL